MGGFARSATLYRDQGQGQSLALLLRGGSSDVVSEDCVLEFCR